MADLLELVPGVDLVTERAALVIQDRPVVGLSGWLLDAAVAAEQDGRELQLVTPSSTRITYPVRTRVLNREDTRWVIDEPDGAYDGASGERLGWDGTRFVPTASAVEPGESIAAGNEQPSDAEAAGNGVSPSWAELRPDVRAGDGADGAGARSEVRANLQLIARVRYQPLETTVVGGAAERLFSELAGAAPAGWGTEEPVSQRWDLDQLTSFCRRWSPRPMMLTMVGPSGVGTRPATGVLEIHNRPGGLEESVMMAIAYDSLEPPGPDELFGVADRLASEFELVSLFLMASGAAADTCVLPRFTGVPAPLALAVGPEARRSLGPEADEALGAGAARAIGPASAPGIWFPIGTGSSEPDWQSFAVLTRRLSRAIGRHGLGPTEGDA